MKLGSDLTLKVTLLMSTFVLLAGATLTDSSDHFTSENAIVTLKFKTQPEKGDVAVSELKRLFESVKKEPHFVSIKLHVDPADNTNILLYEEWESAEYYQGDHMKTPHLEAFMAASREFLAGPPEIAFWTMEGEFK